MEKVFTDRERGKWSLSCKENPVSFTYPGRCVRGTGFILYFLRESLLNITAHDPNLDGNS